jgi:serine/threonine protein phosphatase PrpC
VSAEAPIRASGAATDPGQRSHNEDAHLCDDDLGLYLVADGVGGRDAGEVASRLACETIRARSEQGESLPGAIVAAHRVIREAASSSDRARSMAATIVALRVDGDRFHVAWSGDSRAYLWDGRRLSGLTRDHSLVESLIARGDLSREAAATHPRRNVILAALGGETAEPEIGENEGSLGGEAVFLLGSDGLTDILSPAQICAALADSADPQKTAERLASEARDAGGRDNITVVLLRARAGSGEASPKLRYEIYDAASGEHSWPELPPAPVRVRRVRGRSTETGATTSSAVSVAPEPDPPSAPEPASSPRARPPRWLVAVALLAGLAIAVVILSRFPFTA